MVCLVKIYSFSVALQGPLLVNFLVLIRYDFFFFFFAGYRRVPLFSRTGEDLDPASLFVYVWYIRQQLIVPDPLLATYHNKMAKVNVHIYCFFFSTYAHIITYKNRNTEQIHLQIYPTEQWGKEMDRTEDPDSVRCACQPVSPAPLLWRLLFQLACLMLISRIYNF